MKRISHLILRLGFLWAGFYSSSAFSAESISRSHVRASWLAPKVFAPGKTETVGIYFQIDPEWHIYWKNSGDSGAPPKFNFVDGNYSVGPTQWPVPKRILVGPLTNLGYEKEVTFLFDVTPAADLRFLDLKLKLEWLACKEECIPGFAEMILNRPIGTDALWDTKAKEHVGFYKKRMPEKNSNAGWSLEFVKKTEADLILKLVSKKDAIDRAPELFPVDGEIVNPKAPKVEVLKNEILYTFSILAGNKTPEQLSFLIAAGETSFERRVIIDAPSLESGAKVSNGGGQNYFVLVLFAFLGGIILNLMPCVLPVLSIKFLSVLKASEATRHKEALLYTAGVLTTFFILGSVFLILRSAGAAIGWGFQLQSPYIILFLIFLFWLMALNFFGFFEFGSSITNFTGQFHSAGSFSTGILAVFVAAPCTGPFMGTALGAAAVLPAFQALMIFVTLGFGLAFPFLLISYVPNLKKYVPKPGAWMEKLKQFLAFPLFGTVIWLSWVLSHQVGDEGWQLTSVALLLMTLSVWLGGVNSRPSKVLAVVLFVAVITLSGVGLNRLQAEQAGQDKAVTKQNDWAPYSKEAIVKAQAGGQRVFVDFTASWCVTCQLNKKTVLDTDAAKKIFAENNVFLIRADWTTQDPVITEALEELGRNSVPVYLFYDKDGSTQILPQILTLSIIENLFNKKE